MKLYLSRVHKNVEPWNCACRHAPVHSGMEQDRFAGCRTILFFGLNKINTPMKAAANLYSFVDPKP